MVNLTYHVTFHDGCSYTHSNKLLEAMGSFTVRLKFTVKETLNYVAFLKPLTGAAEPVNLTHSSFKVDATLVQIQWPNGAKAEIKKEGC